MFKYNPIEKIATILQDNKRVRGLYEAKWTLYHSVLVMELGVIILILLSILVVLALK